MSGGGPVAVFGAGGQIGSALVEMLGTEAAPLTRAEVDLTDRQAITDVLERLAPSAIINAAAYTAVDKAESEPQLAEAVNAYAPAAMAEWAARRRVPFVHYSTDYVYRGASEKPWTEDDAPAPLSVYGKSKLAGDQLVAVAGGDHLIFRTSWVYDAHGRNFLNTMLRLGAEREELKVVDDQFGAPSFAPMLAEATLEALDKAREMPSFPSGVYHLCNAGVTSWYLFAEAIFGHARALGLPLTVRRLVPIPASEYPLPAARPSNSRLSLEKLERVFDIHMEDWKDGLEFCMNHKATCHTH